MYNPQGASAPAPTSCIYPVAIIYPRSNIFMAILSEPAAHIHSKYLESYETIFFIHPYAHYLGSRSSGSSSGATLGPSAKMSLALTPAEKSRSLASAPVA